LTSFKLPEGVYYDHLHDLLRERGYVIYAGQAQLADSVFRVANMGALTEAQIEGFLKAFESVLPDAQKLGAERGEEMERLQRERKERDERERAEAEAAEAEAAKVGALPASTKPEAKPEVKTGA
jgi:hypothetical protein